VALGGPAGGTFAAAGARSERKGRLLPRRATRVSKRDRARAAAKAWPNTGGQDTNTQMTGRAARQHETGTRKAGRGGGGGDGARDSRRGCPEGGDESTPWPAARASEANGPWTGGRRPDKGVNTKGKGRRPGDALQRLQHAGPKRKGQLRLEAEARGKAHSQDGGEGKGKRAPTRRSLRKRSRGAGRGTPTLSPEKTDLLTNAEGDAAPDSTTARGSPPPKRSRHGTVVLLGAPVEGRSAAAGGATGAHGASDNSGRLRRRRTNRPTYDEGDDALRHTGRRRRGGRPAQTGPGGRRSGQTHTRGAGCSARLSEGLTADGDEDEGYSPLTTRGGGNGRPRNESRGLRRARRDAG
jgi:hypothetical protein